MTVHAGKRACPACGASVDLSQGEVRFCGRCGADVATVDIAPADATRTTDPSVAIPVLADPMLGRVIDGRYRVQARIGQGGMGVVYRVEHVAMGKVAAMKMLHPSLSQEQEVVRRFRREAEAVSRLSHPNTVQVFDFGEAMGSMYLVMELIRGEDLGALLRRDGPFPWRRLGPILGQALDALTEAHELGIIHRDIKPENIIIARTRDGRDLVKVLDFGLAKLRDVEELNRVTGRGTVLGTPYYMSPEQIRAEDLDARSDLYSLGALAYRALTGEHPFSAPTPIAVLTQHLTAKLEPPRARAPSRDIPPEAEAVVLRAMQRSPADRYQSAETMRVAIGEALAAPARNESNGQTEVARRASDASSPSVSAVGIAERLKREDFDGYEQSLRVRRYLAVSLVPLLLLLAGAGGYYFLHQQAPRVLDEEREPNDDPTHANELHSGRAIRGQVGKRRSVEESDRDFYHLTVAGPSNRLSAEVTGIPEMDLILQVYDRSGQEIAESETGAAGDPEAIFDLRVSPGDYYVQVREVWISGQQPTENVSDWYSLKANADTAPADSELEPNGPSSSGDGKFEPNVIGPSNLSVGRLAHPGDVDCYAFADPQPTAIAAMVTGLPGVDVKLSTRPRNPSSAHPGTGGTRSADRAPAGEGERLEREAWPAGAGAPLVCVERKERTAGAGPSGSRPPHAEHSAHVALTSRGATYKLTVEPTRAPPTP